MPKKAAEELTQDEIKLLVCAAKVMAALRVCMENPPSPDQQWYWDDNICEELITGNRWGTAEKAGTPPNWTGLTLETASKAPTWHQDLFAHDLMPYLQDIPPKKQWWNFPPPLATPDDDVNMEESPSPAPPSPHIPPASQKCAAKGKAQAAPPPLPPDEYGPPQIHRTRSRKRSTVLPDSDGPADTPSEGEDRCGTCKEKGFQLLYEVANTRAPNKPLEYQGIPECLESLEHKIAQSKQLLLAICAKLVVALSPNASPTWTS
ncbi:hypothetical protein EI94DRAFT_1703853 [Lactarius quietus]|nr:hypothetical protein EI94DRAFT_1703853 [Lactarius quietus]